MPRPPRISFPGAVYHVLNRFVDKHPFFLCDDDYREFLETYFDVASACRIRTYAWCLMSNHFHFCIELTDANLSEFLQRFLTRAAKRLNKSRERVGHLLQDRTKSLLIDAENYFATVIGYILLNPVRAGLARHPLEYMWCSGEATLRAESVIPVADLAERVSGRHVPEGRTNRAVEIVRGWLDKLITDDNAKRFDEGQRGTFIGTRDFRRAILDAHERRIKVDPSRSRRAKDIGFRDVDWRAVALQTHNFVLERKSHELGKWSSIESAASDLVVYAMHTLGELSYPNIAEYFDDQRTIAKYTTAVHRIRRNAGRLDEASAWCQALTSLHHRN